MMEWVSPTYLPSIEISAPAGVEVKWHFAVRGPSCRTTAGARSSTRFAGFAISEPGCEAGVAAGAPAVETRAYDCLTSLPFEFRYQTANPRCSLWVTRPWIVMEICGGQTHTIVKSGLEDLLPRDITLVHGPGCPVCVTPIDLIDKAVAIAHRPEVIFCSFGDMLRVPGSTKSLLDAKAEGADVRIVYSPLDAVKLARTNPERQVVFFAVGFETTAPANAMAAWQADHDHVDNFSLLVSHVLVPPAMEALLSSSNCVVQGFLAAGHVCTVMGYEEYFPIAEKYKVPIVVTGFEPLDILDGILMTVSQLEEGRHEVENQYARATRREGNRPAQEAIGRLD